MSAIAYGELHYSVQKNQHIKKNLHLLNELASVIPPLPLPTTVGKAYGWIREKLEKQGKMIGNNDLWIAAHAMVLKLILVTNNVKEFSRIPDLKIENWIHE